MALNQALYRHNPVAVRTSFEDMPPAALRSRYRDFLRLISDRISILEATVRSSDGRANWKADFTAESLQSLYEWLHENTTTRRRTQAEVAEIRRRLALPVPIPAVDLSDETLSLVHDVAMYFASSLVRRHPHLEWTINLHDKIDADYGQPVLIGFPKNVHLNPV